MLVQMIKFLEETLSKLLKMSLGFGHFCHFSPKLKYFESGSMWFRFCSHFHPKAKSGQIFQLIFSFFFFSLHFNKGKMIIFLFNLQKIKKKKKKMDDN
ncbi:hypothetical protein Hanom_Chr10g00954991 [Helianthus anomalus]